MFGKGIPANCVGKRCKWTPRLLQLVLPGVQTGSSAGGNVESAWDLERHRIWEQAGGLQLPQTFPAKGTHRGLTETLKEKIDYHAAWKSEISLNLA